MGGRTMNGITIAIPTYERGAILVDTIRRLLALTPPAAAIMVLDQTPTYAPEIERELDAWSAANAIRWIRLPKPSIPHAMNEALRRATTPYVLFLDDDIIPAPALVAAHEAAFTPGVWAVAGQVLQPGEEPASADPARAHRGVLRDLEFPFYSDAACDVENVMAGNLSVARELALLIGGFDENFVGAAYRFESDFARRIVAGGGRIRFEPRASIRHLKIPTGGIRAHGDQRKSAAPAHSAGDYYFALQHIRPFTPYALTRLVRNIATRYHLLHPWTIVPKLVGEIRGYLLARRLHRAGRRLAR
jgi:GT2 family glycosyltransferase